MDNQKISSFINSKDMQNYLREIQYQFTAPKAAFVVYCCEHTTLKEKMEAWQEMIDTMPDQSMEERPNMIRIDSFHSFLKDYIELKKRDIQNFYSDDGFIYAYECHGVVREDDTLIHSGLNYDGWRSRPEFFFSHYADCVDYCTKEELSDGAIDKVRIFKCPLRQTAGQGRKCPDTITLNGNLDIIDIDISHEDECESYVDLAFEGMCFEFPTPFQRGDILAPYQMHKQHWYRPFVLSYITTWNSKEMLTRGFKEHECPCRKGWRAFDRRTERKLKLGDRSDMDSVGTGIDDNGVDLYIDNMKGMPINLEYYREPLKGFERQLQVFSCYEKREIDAEILTNCCSAIRIEEYSKIVRRRCTSLYTREAMKQTGMLLSDKNQEQKRIEG